MSVSILVPWTSAVGVSAAERDRSWEWNRRRLQALFPAEIVLGAPDVVGDPAIFSRSLALNRAAAEATGSVLLVVDADTTYAPADFFAVVEAARGGAWTLPERYVRLGSRTSDAWMRCAPKTPIPMGWEGDVEQEYPFANSGVVAIPRAAFDAVGGFDERFKGWGGEDDAMRAALETIWEPPTRIGIAYHLWHPRPPEHSTYAPYTAESFMLADRYGAASGDLDAMAALLAERPDPR